MKHNIQILSLLMSTLFISANCSAQDLPFSGTKNPKANYYFGEALKSFQMEDYMKTYNLADKALALDPNFIDVYMLQAEMKMNDMKRKEAIALYDKITQINPEFPMSYYGKAKALVALNQYDEAIKNMEKFMTYPDHYGKKAEMERMLKNAKFASNAVKNPVPFEPHNLGPNINTAQNEYFPGITSDEQTLIFTRLVDNQNEEFYVSLKQNKNWTRALNLGSPINTERNEGTVSLSADGQYIFYTACNREGGLGSCDLYISKLDGASWSEPKNLGSPVSSSYWESQPSVSFDGKTVYFSSNRPGGYGNSDIWYTTFKAGKWSPPVNMGPEINTAADEQSPFIAKDDQTLYFNSTGHEGMGGVDLFVIRKTPDGRWMNAQNLGYPINSEKDETCITIASNGIDAYIAKVGSDTYGGLDLYAFELYEKARPNKTGYVKGIVFDAISKKKLSAKVELIDLATGKTVVESYANKLTGEFLVSLQGNKNYALNVSANGYLFNSENFELKNQSAVDPLIMNVPLQSITSGSKIILKNVFFDTDKFVLKDESKVELGKLVQFMQANPQVKIEIGGHTDNTGDPKKNLILSTNRAKAVNDFLATNGIDPKRLTFKGYADSQPIDDNKTTEGRAKNRRTEAIILP